VDEAARTGEGVSGFSLCFSNVQTIKVVDFSKLKWLVLQLTNTIYALKAINKEF
jgi:hypothetical protein